MRIPLIVMALCLPATAAEVVLTQPHCDRCSAEDKAWLRPRSALIARTVALIDQAQVRVDAAQFTFSVAEIEQALLRAHQRGVAVRLVMDLGQEKLETAGPRLAAAGVPVRFVGGARRGDQVGLQHAKFLLTDGTLAMGSSNWSSTGTTLNEEGWIVVDDTALVGAFTCRFNQLWDPAADEVGACGVEGRAHFTPGTEAVALLTDGLRGAQTSIDVLMHHLLFEKLVKELARAAARGVVVRVVVNAVDRAELAGPLGDRLRAAGVRIRYKRGNADQHQLMHHKLAVVDGRVLLHGSGNWSGSAFFNNSEFFVRHDDPAVVGPFARRFAELWDVSLTAESLDAGLDPARQRAASTRIFFGNLHAHFPAGGDGRAWDDGKAERRTPEGAVEGVPVPADVAGAARFAFEYARDRGRLDFLALTPHTVDDAPNDPADMADMEPAGFAELRRAADEVTAASSGRFLALAGMEWNTNTRGNHVNLFGSSVVAKVPRGRFDLLYDGFLAERARAGEPVWLMLNHPRTFRRPGPHFEGAWDQSFDGPLSQVPNKSERTQKFNDYGLDDYPPLSAVLPDWISGEGVPDRAVVAQTFTALEVAMRPYARLMEVTVGRGTELMSEVPQNPSLAARDPEEAVAPAAPASEAPAVAPASEAPPSEAPASEAPPSEAPPSEAPPSEAAAAPASEAPPTEALVRITKVRPDWEHYLLAGFRLAPAANHDNHAANWGTGHTSRTAVVAASLAPADFDAAVAARAVYASEDENLALRFHAGETAVMGGTLTWVGKSVAGEVWLEDPDFKGPFVVRVYRGRIGGTAVEPVLEVPDAPSGWLPVTLPLPEMGRWFFYVEVHEPGPDRMAWSAPIWVERVGP